MQTKQPKRYRRHKRVRAKISGSAKIPRISVFRSAKHIYAQLVDDREGATLVWASSKELRKKKGQKKFDAAKEVGKLIAKKAIEKKIEKAVFDRGGYKYHGRVKALAEGVREGGLKF